jgi:hypothetical protein
MIFFLVIAIADGLRSFSAAFWRRATTSRNRQSNFKSRLRYCTVPFRSLISCTPTVCTVLYMQFLSGHLIIYYCHFLFEIFSHGVLSTATRKPAAPRAFCSFHTDICMRDLIRTVHNPLVIHQFQNVNRGIKYKTSVTIQSRVRHLWAPKRWSPNGDSKCSLWMPWIPG